MSWKTVVLGGLAMYAVTFVVGLPMGMIVHEGILDADYRAHESFWRPELNEDPPDMGALMPRWVTLGVLTSLVIASIYPCVAVGLGSPGWANGMKYGFICALFMCCFNAGWSGIFNLPDKIWIVWGLESFVYYLPGGAVLGLLHKKFSA